MEAIDRAIQAAREVTARPSLILVRTHLGYGSPHKQDTFSAHGSPLGVDEVRLTKERLGWPAAPAFLIPTTAEAHFRQSVARGRAAEQAWETMLAGYAQLYPDEARVLDQLINRVMPDGWDAHIPVFPSDGHSMATRVASGIVLNVLAGKLLGLIGGAADLAPSTKTELKDMGNFESRDTATGDLQGAAAGGWSHAGRNLQFGVREHAMGAILNGMMVHGGLRPFGATFLVFSDYLRPSIRLAALMGIPVVYVFTHDSIAMGEDGPTHQAVEQVASLRSIPGLLVIRPADANETAVAWCLAMESTDRPVALVLTRQDVPTIDRRRFAAAAGVRRGAYVLSDPGDGKPMLILIATGSEVGLILAAGEALSQKGIAIRLVSMPCWKLFAEQSQEYRDSVLPPTVRARLAVEAGVTQGWHRYIGDQGDIIGLDHFGASAPGPVVLRKFGFSVEHVCERAIALLEKVHV